MAHKFDQADEYPHEIVEQMKELGLFGATISPEYGGSGLSAWDLCPHSYQGSECLDGTVGYIQFSPHHGSGYRTSWYRSAKNKYLPIMATGEFRGSLALTEPNAGSDLQAIRTVATKTGDHYVINGSKTWITNSLHGNATLLLVKTDPSAEARHRGMSLIIAEKGEGFVVTSKLKKLGYKAIDCCALTFEDYRVHEDQLLGGFEGMGFKQTVSGLEIGRINVAARGAGIGEGALLHALRYAQERSTFGQAICNHQTIQQKLADMVKQVEGAKKLIETAAIKYDKGERCDPEAAMAKLTGSEAGVFCSQEAMRIFGGYSYSEDIDVCWAPVKTLPEALQSEQIIARGVRLELADSKTGGQNVTQLGIPIKYRNEPGQLVTDLPSLGVHTIEVLLEAGYSQYEEDDLLAEKAIY